MERYCELANKTTQQLYKVSTTCIDDHHFKEEELKSVGELSQVCSQIVLKCLYLARLGRPDILWSVNKFARSITKWTNTFDKGLSRLISYIHHTCEYKQHCHVGNTAKQCRLGLTQDSVFAGDLEDSKSSSGGKHFTTMQTFQDSDFAGRMGGLRINFKWTLMCIREPHVRSNKLDVKKKQTAVSHSSTESEIISLDAGLRLDGIPALGLWDPIVAVLHGNTYHSNQEWGDLCTNHREVREVPHTLQKRKQSQRVINDLNNVDLFPQMSNSRIKKLCSMCLRTTKQ